MSIFPFISYDENIVKVKKELPLYREFAWDYKTNTPILKNGNLVIVTGKEAIKVWCYKALLTNKYHHAIYSDSYGSELMKLIGMPYSKALAESESKRYIEETLIQNEYITDVNVTNSTFVDDKITCQATVKTVYGDVNINYE